MKRYLLLIFVLALTSFGLEIKKMELISSAFKNTEMIPSLYTCDGKNISPPILWNHPPEKTKSLALICDDPDAPNKTWVHWIVYNIKPTSKELPAKILSQEKLSNGARQGINDFGKIGYGGPCPPSGIHRYFFKLYALDTELEIQQPVTKEKLERAIDGHILEEAILIGKYSNH